MWWKNQRAARSSVKRIDQILAEGAQRVARSWEDQEAELILRTETPIEGLLLAALYKDHDLFDFTVHFAGIVDEPIESVCGTVVIYQQEKVSPYRVDFLIDYSSSTNAERRRWVIVECDGHDFHERTKEQARRDRARDRFFQSKGCRVLRFTGSKIWANPEECAAEIWAQLGINDEREVRA